VFRSEFCRKCVGRLRNTEADTCVRPYKGSPTVCTIISPPGLLYCYFGQGQLANFSGVKASPNCAKHCIPNCWGLNSWGGGVTLLQGSMGVFTDWCQSLNRCVARIYQFRMLNGRSATTSYDLQLMKTATWMASCNLRYEKN